MPRLEAPGLLSFRAGGRLGEEMFCVTIFYKFFQTKTSSYVLTFCSGRLSKTYIHRIPILQHRLPFFDVRHFSYTNFPQAHSRTNVALEQRMNSCGRLGTSQLHITHNVYR